MRFFAAFARPLVIVFLAVLASLPVAPEIAAQNVDELYEAARAAHDGGDFEKAIDLYTKVIEADSTYANAYWNRGNLWPEENNARALADYRMVSKLVPDFDGGHGNLGWSLLMEGRFEEARRPSQIASNLDTSVYSWPLNLGHTFLLTGRADSARTYYRWAIIRMESVDDLQSALNDFDLFIARGWAPEESQEIQQWMRRAYNRD